MQSSFYRTHNLKFFDSANTSKHTIPLLHIEQTDIKKIYELKKTNNPKSLHPKPPNNKHWISQQQKQIKIQLSAQQKIELYKKTQYQQKLSRKKKQNEDVNPRTKIIPTPLKKYLKRMSHFSVIQKQYSYLSEIKDSEKELHFVKCNPTRKRRIASCGPSRDFHRSRVLSLKDGLPINLGNLYPTIQQKIDQLKPPPAIPKPSLLESVQKSILLFFHEPTNKNNPNEQINYLENQKLKEQKLINKAKGNINRSVDTTEKFMRTVTGFYSMKKEHKKDYEGLISTWKVDRPKTHEIRSRNYDISAITKAKKRNMLEKFRETSQNIRSNEIERSKGFYNELIDFVVGRTKVMENVPVTKGVCDEIREELEVNLKLGVEFLMELAGRVEEGGERDELIDEVIKRTREYIDTNL